MSETPKVVILSATSFPANIAFREEGKRSFLFLVRNTERGFLQTFLIHQQYGPRSAEAGAAFVVSPCCVGKVGKLSNRGELSLSHKRAKAAAARAYERRPAAMEAAAAEGTIAVGADERQRKRALEEAAAVAAMPRLPRSERFGRIMGSDEYLALAAAADFHSTEAPAPRRKAAKSSASLPRCTLRRLRSGILACVCCPYLPCRANACT